MTAGTTTLGRSRAFRLALIALALAAVVAMFVPSLQPYLRQASGSGELTSFYEYERTTADLVTELGYDFVVSDPMTMYSVEGLTLIPGVSTVRRWIRTSEYTVKDQQAFDDLWLSASGGDLRSEICELASERAFNKAAFVVTPRTERWLLINEPTEHFVVAHGPKLDLAPVVATSQLGPPIAVAEEVQIFDVSCQ